MSGIDSSIAFPPRNTPHACLYTKRELADMLREFAKLSGHDQAVIYQLINQRAGGAQ